MRIGTIFARYYSEFILRQLHIPRLLADLMLWCRNKKIPVRLIVEEASILEDNPLPAEWYSGDIFWFGMGMQFESPKVAAKTERESKDSAFSQAANDREAVMDEILVAMFGRADRDAAVEMVRAVIQADERPGAILYYAAPASREMMIFMDERGGTNGSAIGGRDWYTFERVENSLSQEQLAAFCTFAGIDPQERPAVHGLDVSRFMEALTDRGGDDRWVTCEEFSLPLEAGDSDDEDFIIEPIADITVEFGQASDSHAIVVSSRHRMSTDGEFITDCRRGILLDADAVSDLGDLGRRLLATIVEVVSHTADTFSFGDPSHTVNAVLQPVGKCFLAITLHPDLKARAIECAAAADITVDEWVRSAITSAADNAD